MTLRGLERPTRVVIVSMTSLKRTRFHVVDLDGNLLALCATKAQARTFIAEAGLTLVGDKHWGRNWGLDRYPPVKGAP